MSHTATVCHGCRQAAEAAAGQVGAAAGDGDDAESDKGGAAAGAATTGRGGKTGRGRGRGAKVRVVAVLMRGDCVRCVIHWVVRAVYGSCTCTLMVPYT